MEVGSWPRCYSEQPERLAWLSQRGFSLLVWQMPAGQSGSRILPACCLWWASDPTLTDRPTYSTLGWLVCNMLRMEPVVGPVVLHSTSGRGIRPRAARCAALERLQPLHRREWHGPWRPLYLENTFHVASASCAVWPSVPARMQVHRRPRPSGPAATMISVMCGLCSCSSGL